MIRPRRSRPVPGWLVALGVVWLAAGSALTASPARADEPASSVQISIASLTPAVPEPDDTVVITGTVTNTSKGALSKVQALMWRNQAPITDSEQMTGAVESAADDPLGSRIDVFGTWQQLTRSNDPTTVDLPARLAPGASMPFTVRASMKQFQFPGTPGVYLVGVQIRGTTDGLDGVDLTLGRARTFLPVGVADTAVERPVPVCSVIVLSAAPSQLTAAGTGTPASFLDDSLVRSVSPGGALDRLLALVSQPGYSVLADPAVVASVRDLTKAHTVRQPDGSQAERPASSAAQAWLDRLGQVPADRMFQLPYANPDLAALAHTGQQDLYRPELGADILPGVPRIALPAGGQADEATLQLAGTGDIAAILLSREATATSDPVLTTPAVPVPVVTFDQAALDGGPGPDPRTTPAQIRQRYLADTMIAATGDRPAAVVRLITTARQATAVPAVRAPWLAAVSLSDLLQTTPQPWLSALTYPAAERQTELSPATVRAAAELARDYTTYAELQVAPAAGDTSAAAAVARATSVHWRGDAEGARSYLAPQRAILDQFLDGGLRIDRLNKILLTNESGETGFSVINDTDVDVRVRVGFTSTNAQRLTVADIGDTVIPRRSRVLMKAEITAQANGDVPMTAQLTTVNGTPVGQRVDFIVSATQYGRVGALIAVLAAVVLFVSSFLRIRQVRRESAASGEAEIEGMIDTRGPRPEPPPVSPGREPASDRARPDGIG